MIAARSAWRALPVGLLLAQFALSGCAPNVPMASKSLAELVAVAPDSGAGPQTTETPATPAPGKFEFVGTVQDAGGGTITIDGHVMAVTAQTEIDPTLKVGDRVKVSGYVQADGSLVATEVQLADQEGQVSKFEWVGEITSIEGATWVVGGMTFTLNSVPVPSGVAVGMFVKLEGFLGADGQWVITSIELEGQDKSVEIEDASGEDEIEAGGEEIEAEDDVEEVHDASHVHEAETESREEQDHSGAEHTGGDD